MPFLSGTAVPEYCWHCCSSSLRSCHCRRPCPGTASEAAGFPPRAGTIWAAGFHFPVGASQAPGPRCCGSLLTPPLEILNARANVQHIRNKQSNTETVLGIRIRMFFAGLRIRIGSGFNRVCGSGIRIRIQEGKNDPQK
jgi:hypothetical protein